MKDFREIVYAIKKDRKEFDKDQTAFAEDLGLTRQNLNQYFSTNRTPYGYLAQWCHKNNLSFDHLVFNGKLESQQSVSSSAGIHAFTCTDNSMAPTVLEGEIVEFKPMQGAHQIEDGKIYIYKHKENMKLARFCYTFDGQNVLVKKDSLNFPDSTISESEAKSVIKGIALNVKKDISKF
jgi:hypothetical protein